MSAFLWLYWLGNFVLNCLSKFISSLINIKRILYYKIQVNVRNSFVKPGMLLHSFTMHACMWVFLHFVLCILWTDPQHQRFVTIFCEQVHLSVWNKIVTNRAILFTIWWERKRFAVKISLFFKDFASRYVSVKRPLDMSFR